MPNIGDALKKVVEERPQDVHATSHRTTEASQLMNLNRRRIFQCLCHNPCSTLGQIVGYTGLSRSTASWHLDMLEKSAYVQSGGQKLKYYYPVGFISPDNVPLFATLAMPENFDVHAFILKNPGFDATSLASISGLPLNRVRKAIGALLVQRLIVKTIDGRYVRYYPTSRFAEVIVEEARTRKQFIGKLVKRLSDERLMPEIDDLKGPNTVVTLNMHGMKDTLVIPRHFSTPEKDSTNYCVI
jgi:DNA-binding transcriptional ArsR family regulator